MTFAQLDHRQSHALGTGISLGVHALILAAVLFFTAIRSPGPVPAPHVPIALFSPNLARPGSPGSIGGSGMGAGREQRKSAAPPREVTPTDHPLDKPIENAVPAMTLDATNLLPGSAIEITVGRGTGPGAGTERGAGFGRQPGSGTGAGGSGESGDDGLGTGDGITSPRLIHEVKPNYTVEAMRAKIQGRVELDVVVLPDGTTDPKRIRIVHSLDSTFGLDAQAVDAVKQWRFRPGTNRHQQPVPVRVRVELTFTLR